MSKTIQNAVKRIKQDARIKASYDQKVVIKDMVKNDESVRKFFESLAR